MKATYRQFLIFLAFEMNMKLISIIYVNAPLENNYGHIFQGFILSILFFISLFSVTMRFFINKDREIQVSYRWISFFR